MSDAIEDTGTYQRVVWLLGQVKALYQQKYDDHFVSETRDDKGRQIVRSIWLFNQVMAIELKDPAEREDFAFIPFASLLYIEVAEQHFDLNIPPAKDSSRMSVLVRFANGVEGTFQASRVNCGDLLRVTNKWLLPRLRP